LLLRGFFSATRRDISAILFAVRNAFAGLVLVAGATAFAAPPAAQAPSQSSAQQASEQQMSVPPQAQSSQPAAPTVTRGGPMIVLDPAHGGTDPGARGEGGAIEKDVVLEFAKAVRAELERQGFRVVMTRSDDSGPTYDERAAMANMYRDAIFFSFHVSSTGTAGTARAYYFQFPNPPRPPEPPSETVLTKGTTAQKEMNSAIPILPGLPLWSDAQRPFAETSHHLADLLQAELAQRFAGSPVTSTGVAIRGLRSIAAPAVAIEISSVTGSTPVALTGMAEPLASSVVRSMVVFRPAGSMEMK
jgi:N-acetylmuramoyl-L-alanine amidase